MEQKTANTILQKSRDIGIAGRNYKYSPPTVATLIAVSGMIGELPSLNLDNENVFAEVFRVAPECDALGKIVATLILGTKPSYNLISKVKIYLLSERILLNQSPQQLYKLVADLLSSLEVVDFFALITSLGAVNLLKATKEVTETTPSGQ